MDTQSIARSRVAHFCVIASSVLLALACAGCVKNTLPSKLFFSVLAAALALCGLVGLLLSPGMIFKLLSARRVPVSSLADAPAGELCRLSVTTEEEAPLEAPLTGRRCHSWRVQVWVISGMTHFTEFKDKAGGGVAVRDDSDCASVDVNDSCWHLSNEPQSIWGSPGDYPPRLDRLLRDRLMDPERADDERFTSEEWCVEAGRPLQIVGHVRRDAEGLCIVDSEVFDGSPADALKGLRNLAIAIPIFSALCLGAGGAGLYHIWTL